MDSWRTKFKNISPMSMSLMYAQLMRFTTKEAGTCREVRGTSLDLGNDMIGVGIKIEVWFSRWSFSQCGKHLSDSLVVLIGIVGSVWPVGFVVSLWFVWGLDIRYLEVFCRTIGI
jgi:hypothetical protein